MGLSYLTKYQCWNDNCTAILDTETEADEHCYKSDEIAEIYICEICGYETNDPTDVITECRLHS